MYVMFLDLEKAFDRVPRKVIGVMERKVLASTEMRKNTKTSVKINEELSKEFEVKVVVH